MEHARPTYHGACKNRVPTSNNQSVDFTAVVLVFFYRKTAALSSLSPGRPRRAAGVVSAAVVVHLMVVHLYREPVPLVQLGVVACDVCFAYWCIT